MGRLGYKFKVFCAGLLSLVAVVACSEVKTIPESELEEILTASILRQALIDSQNLGYRKMQKGIDSIDYHSEILSQYGYTLSDFSHTITQLSQRKSNPLDDILLRVATDIDAMADVAERRYHAFKRFDTLALEYAQDTVFVNDTLYRGGELKNFRVVLLDSLEPGNYEFVITSLNSPHQLHSQRTMKTYFSDSLTKHRTVVSSLWLSREGVEKEQKLNVTLAGKNRKDSMVVYIDETVNSYVRKERVRLGNKIPKDTSYVKSVKVIYTPPIAIARERFYESFLSNDFPLYRDYVKLDYPAQSQRLSPKRAEATQQD